MTEKKLTFEAMEQDVWNAVALPIPLDASVELLAEIHSWSRHFAQVYGDALQGERYGFKEEREPEDEQRRKLRMAQMRIVQTEWRLNVLGLYYQLGPKAWVSPEENSQVQYLIKRMAEPGNYEDPSWRPNGFRWQAPHHVQSREEPKRLTRLWHRIRGIYPS
jgi:hypothetical protein